MDILKKEIGSGEWRGEWWGEENKRGISWMEERNRK